MKWIVDKEIELSLFLQEHTQYSLKKIKQLLKFENVYINHKSITNMHYIVHIGDVVEIIYRKQTSEISILYEDKDIIIVDKPSNILTIANANEKEKTLYHLVSNYVKKNHKQGKIFIVHRLDQQTSGIVIFAKNEKTKQILQTKWQTYKRYYQAIVHGKVTTKHEILKNYLLEDRNFQVQEDKKGKLAITEYTLLKSNSQYSLLDIQIHTGRKNQIRFQLNQIHHPIVGDKKYGIKDNQKRLYLHAYKLIFIHPITQKELTIISPIPQEFSNIIS